MSASNYEVHKKIIPEVDGFGAPISRLIINIPSAGEYISTIRNDGMNGHSQKVLIPNGFWVAEKHRGNGVGSKLVEAMGELAVDNEVNQAITIGYDSLFETYREVYGGDKVFLAKKVGEEIVWSAVNDEVLAPTSPDIRMFRVNFSDFH